MANRIISFGTTKNLLDPSSLSSTPSLSSFDVYKDVNMQSIYSNDELTLSKWKVDKSVNVQAVFNSLRNIFTWNQGERILLPEFGSRLHMLLYEGITPMTEEAIIAEIRSCVSEWEPRIQITSIVNASTIEDTEDNVIHIQVMFIIPALGNEQYTYDFSYTKGS